MVASAGEGVGEEEEEGKGGAAEDDGGQDLRQEAKDRGGEGKVLVTDGRYPRTYVLLIDPPSPSSSLLSLPPSLFPHLYCNYGRHLVLGPWTGAKQLADLRVCL